METKTTEVTFEACPNCKNQHATFLPWSEQALDEYECQDCGAHIRKGYVLINSNQ